ncbi:MAG: hypothetical protein H8E48_00240, partial [Chloroflexi bacterium]|nr:hypothetical protein [Chloroflexota bacterium]
GAPGGANHAATTESVVRCRPLRNSTFWRQSIARDPNRVTVGDWKGMDVSRLASARVRSGVRAWEVDRLYLPDQEPEQALDLLEQVVQCAGSRGAERVFLRVLSNSPISDMARKTGFYPYFEETHLVAQESSQALSQPGDMGRIIAQERAAPDMHGLFQLYCASTPHRVREGVGLTIDQWHDSQESAQTHSNETVLKLDDKIVGWWTHQPFGKTSAGRMQWHPNHPEVVSPLMQLSHQTQNWLIPSYQENITELLTRQGFHEAGRYIMLIKTVAVPVRSRELSYVEA